MYLMHVMFANINLTLQLQVQPIKYKYHINLPYPLIVLMHDEFRGSRNGDVRRTIILVIN